MAGEDEIVALGETDEENSFSKLVGVIKSKFQSSENARQFDEKRWLRAYRNYRGIYGSDTAFSSKEKSRVFVKITKTKINLINLKRKSLQNDFYIHQCHVKKYMLRCCCYSQRCTIL